MRTLRWTWQVYAVAVIVFAASLTLALVLPIPDTFRGIASVPGAAALVGILVQLWRDSLAHQRELELKERDNDFALTVASHMSTVVFDKHVAFCEAYFDRVNVGIMTLTGAGPRPHTRDFAHDLGQIRRKYSPWLTREIEDGLFPMEHALVKIGAAAGTLENLPVGTLRTKLVDEMSAAFMVIVGLSAATTEDEKRTAAETILERIREVLGTKELTRLRVRAVTAAAERIDDALRQ